MSVSWAELRPSVVERWTQSAGLGQVARFAGVGVLSTIAHLSLFALFQTILESSQVANVASLVIATVLNTSLNRRWTFGVRGSGRLGIHHVQALAVFVLTWGASSLALMLLHVAVADPAPLLQVASILLGNAGATVVRFVAMRHWIFKRHEVAAAAVPD